MSASDSRMLLHEWNQTQLQYSLKLCLHHLFEQQAARTPDKIAVKSDKGRFPYEELSYGELDKRANQMARRLLDLGVGPGKLVGICLHRRAGMMLALLGVMKAGGAYLPLDPDYPQERLAYMVEDSNPAVLILDSDLSGRFSAQLGRESKIPTVIMDTERADIEAYSSVNPAIAVTQDSTAYVIYTSGSTGKPKGVVIPHAAVVNFLKSMSVRPGFSQDDTLLAVTTLSFDIAVLELYLPLITGGSLVIAGQEESVDGRRIVALMEKYDVSVMQATPATWRMLLQSDTAWKQPIKILSGGEALSKDLSSALSARASELWNMYGPTETTVWSTVYQVKAADADILIGRPIHNTQLYILDRNQQPVPVGIPGELYIGGQGLADCYLNRPELTSQRFVDNPFSDLPDARLYRTGDQARYRADGNIECFGRLDNQVKIRGFRIELGEIENALAGHPGVEESVLANKEYAAGDNRLVAYYITKQEIDGGDRRLREYLQRFLPDYMIPQYFVALESFPLTPAGKVDRLSLPMPDLKSLSLEYLAPETEVERQLSVMWSDILRVEKPGLNDDFFELGGHSLLAVKLSAEIYKYYNIHLNLRVLFSNPTLKNQSDLIEGLTEDAKPDYGDEREDLVI